MLDDHHCVVVADRIESDADDAGDGRVGPVRVAPREAQPVRPIDCQELPVICIGVPELSISKRNSPPTRASTLTATHRTGRGHIHSINDSESSHCSNTTSGGAGVMLRTRTTGAPLIGYDPCVAAGPITPRRGATKTSSARGVVM